jgi:hypothetical protein
MGCWRDLESAAHAYNYAVKRLHGDFSVLNNVNIDLIDTKSVENKVDLRFIKLGL